MIKTCAKCNLEKKLFLFNKDKQAKYGVSSYCRECRGLIRSSKKEAERVYNKKYYQNHKAENLLKCAKYRKLNRSYLKKYNKKFTKYRIKWVEEHTKASPLFNLTLRLKQRLRECFRNLKVKKKNKAFDLLGYSKTELFEHLSKFFDLPCKVCHRAIIKFNRKNFVIDHIIPVGFVVNLEELILLNQFNNLRLICKKCNGCKISEDKRYIKEKRLKFV